MDAQVKLLVCILVTCFVACSHAQSDSQVALPSGASGPFRLASLASGSEATSSRQRQEFEAAKIIARVGDQVVLAGDLFGQVNQFLHQRMQEVPEAQRALLTPELISQRRWDLIKQLLPQIVDGKLIYLDFLRSIPSERLTDIEDSLYQAFDEQRMPQLIEQAKVDSASELDSLLRSFGSSLGQQRRTFAEQLAAMQWRERNGKDNREVSHEELVNYYREHIDDYRVAAKCRWEQLSAHDSETFSKANSKKLIAKMGNKVWGGASFAAIAKKSSHGFTAAEGGKYDWTTKDSLRSEPINKAIFSLPLGRLSPIIEDDLGCHIVRVIERQDESVIPFAEVQGDIRKKIREDRSKTAMQEYVEKLRGEFPVWTVFDE